MNNLLEKLENDYVDYVFIGGGTAGRDYLEFQMKYRKALKEVASGINANLVSFNKSHYSFSAFIERDGKYVFLSISDVRYFKDWRNDILIRKASDSKDYTGGFNQRANIYNLEEELDRLLS